MLALTVVFLLATAGGCNLEFPEPESPKITLFVGIDASGSFKSSGLYENAIDFAATYLYGQINEVGGLAKPRALFVGSVGGKTHDEPKTFHPIHDFEERSIEEITRDLHEWFKPRDTLTDYNAFFEEVARITKERNLLLSPITVLLLTDGVPDMQEIEAGSDEIYRAIDLKPMEYLSRNLTVRLAYVSPMVAKKWRTLVPRQRVRVWTVDSEVMGRWKQHIEPGQPIEAQARFWKWMQDNVNFPTKATAVH
jgi:hypothetical protein